MFSLKGKVLQELSILFSKYNFLNSIERSLKSLSFGLFILSQIVPRIHFSIDLMTLVGLTKASQEISLHS